jgi:hypothetical protein
MKETRTIKVWLDTYRLLKILSARSGETLVEMLDRLARQEDERQVQRGMEPVTGIEPAT